jgi:hypothetical protein
VSAYQIESSPNDSAVVTGVSASGPNSSVSGMIHESGVIGKSAWRRSKVGVAMSSNRMLPLQMSIQTTPPLDVAWNGALISSAPRHQRLVAPSIHRQDRE